MPGPEKNAINYAIANGGVIGRKEALALGMSSRTIDRRLATGTFVTVAPGILALPGVLHDERSLLRAAAAAIGGVASHQSAARLLGLDIRETTPVVVTVPIRRTNRFLDLTVHQSTDLDSDQVTFIDGIPVTDPPRCILDLAAIYKAKPLGDLLDQAVQLRLTTIEQVGRRLVALARQGKPGVVMLRHLLTLRSDEPLVVDSVLERKLVRVLTNGGLAVPATQYRPPWLLHIDGRVDVAYLEHRVIVEADSRRWHGSPERFQADRRRDNLAQLAGWTILRFTWEDVTRRPDYVVSTARAALDRSVSDLRHIRR